VTSKAAAVVALWLAPLPVGAQSPGCVAPEAMVRLDHVPIAVADLEGVAGRLTDFGFHIGPGRRHANGLENLHIRFRDGSGLELMAVTSPGDALARHYASLISDGGGGAYLALSGLPVDSVLALAHDSEPALAATRSAAFDWAAFPLGHPLAPVFFVDVHDRARDRPEQFDHPNRAVGLAAVWVAVEHPERLIALLERFGARDCGLRQHPEHLTGHAVGVAGGTVYVVDAGLWEADPGSAPVLSITVEGGGPGPIRTLILGEAGGLWLEVTGGG